MKTIAEYTAAQKLIKIYYVASVKVHLNFILNISHFVQPKINFH